MSTLSKIHSDSAEKMGEIISLGGKRVQLRRPYDATVAELVGMERYLKAILASWMRGRNSPPLAPLLIGDAGIGKSRIAVECAKLTGKPLFIEQGREDLTDEDLTCMARISDDPDRKIDYILSNLGTAMVMGGIYFIDGVCKLRPRSQSPFESVLDDRRYVDSVLLGTRIKAHPAFRFIAATNPEDMDENPLPDFMASRLRPVIHFGYPEPRETEIIIKKHCPAIKKKDSALFACFWDQWRKYSGGRPPAPRDSIKIFNLAQNLADFEKRSDRRPLEMEHHGTPTVINTKHVKEAFRIFFDKGSRR